MPAVVEIRRAELEPEVTVEGLKVTLTPGGVPVAVRDTCWALPVTVVVLTVALTADPASTLPLAGLRASEKSVSCRVQVGSPLWAGMSIAFQAALVASNRPQDASRFLAAVRVAVR
ncbi:hypothetical protein STENM36S_07780 [Streptomyces tendae]